MITGGAFRNERLILAAEGDVEASVIKSGLCGSNNYISIAPYGNKVNITVSANTIAFKKQSALHFTYEEAFTLIRKVQLCDKLSGKIADLLLKDARKQLESRLTLFYPGSNDPVAQVTYSYNWVAFETTINDFQNAQDELTATIGSSEKDRFLKIFSNSPETISIHNYDMNGIYTSRALLTILAETIAKHGALKEDDQDTFILRTIAFGVKSVIYMEARQLCQNVDETFNMEDDKHYNPVIGQKDFILPFFRNMQEVVKTGSLSALDANIRGALVAIAKSPDAIDQYALSDTNQICISRFVQDFRNEILS